MELDVQIIQGPPTARISKAQAEEALRKHPDFPRNASYKIDELEGRWIAAISSVKQAAPPAFAEGGDEPAGPPVDDGASADSFDGGDDKPSDDEGEEKPKEDKGEKGKGEAGELKQVLHMLTTLMDALGLSPQGPEDSPVPGPDGEVAPPGPGPEGLEPGVGADNKTHTVHERALKPGEAPPGTTPVGAPSFASTNHDHPWAEVLGKKRSFTVQEEIGSQDMSTVAHELSALCAGTGYEVKQLREGTARDNKRVARAIIAKAA